MLDGDTSQLTFSSITYGTHAEPWDLSVLLYKGATSARRHRARALIEQGHFGQLDRSRLSVVLSFHQTISARLAQGRSCHTVEGHLDQVWAFVRWIDTYDHKLEIDDLVSTFLHWADHLFERVSIKRDMLAKTALHRATIIAGFVANAVDPSGTTNSRALLRQIRLRGANPSSIGSRADRVSLESSVRFGHLLADICAGLDSHVVRGPLPVTIPVRDGRSLFIAGSHRLSEEQVLASGYKRKQYEKSRQPLTEGSKVFEDPRRGRLLTLRVEAELLIFVSQSGMNLAQAADLRRENYRWQTDGNELLAYRVYKNRRGGEAIFRCFKVYRQHLSRYLEWLDETGISSVSEKLFPFFHHGMIPAERSLPKFTATHFASDQLRISWVGPRSLRKTRVNWLLRRGSSIELTAEMSAHTTQTLLKYYEEPHHQIAASEIVRFHASTDPYTEAAGPGQCGSAGRGPKRLHGAPAEAPTPDCISPDGCMFCIYHRDVASSDYCLKLASHAYLKALEVTLYRPAQREAVHPGNLVIDRVEAKLMLISDQSELGAQWVRDAKDNVRAGKPHPVWQGHIEILEVLV